jgi:hypothetical protein
MPKKAKESNGPSFWDRLPLLGPTLSASPGAQFRGRVDTTVTFALATVPLWLGLIVAPSLNFALPGKVDAWNGIKHGELFVAATALLAPILSALIRGQWPNPPRPLYIGAAALLVVFISVGFFFALLSNPQSYASWYTIIWSAGTFMLAGTTFYSYAVQAAVPSVESPAAMEQHDLTNLSEKLAALRRREAQANDDEPEATTL